MKVIPVPCRVSLTHPVIKETADYSFSLIPTFVQDDNYEYLIIDESVRLLPFP